MKYERLEFSQVEGPSIEVAFTLAANGNWRDAANHFYTLSELATDSEIKTRHLIDLSQMLINLEEFDHARDILDEADKPTSEILARIYEKQAWIADYEGDFEKELNYLQKAKNLTSDGVLASTINHFMGRAHLGLAAQDKNPKFNTPMARRFFERDLKGAIAKKEENPAGVAFAMAWIARCDLLENKLSDAKKRLPIIQAGFAAHREKNPDSGIEAHYYLIKGEVELQEGNLSQARSDYEKALNIQIETERHPRSIAKAYLGMANCYELEGNSELADANNTLAMQASRTILSNSYF